MVLVRGAKNTSDLPLPTSDFKKLMVDGQPNPSTLTLFQPFHLLGAWCGGLNTSDFPLPTSDFKKLMVDG